MLHRNSTKVFNPVSAWNCWQWVTCCSWNETTKPHCFSSVPPPPSSAAILLCSALGTHISLIFRDTIRYEMSTTATEVSFWAPGTSFFRQNFLTRSRPRSSFTPFNSTPCIYSNMTLLIDVDCVRCKQNQEAADYCPRPTSISPLLSWGHRVPTKLKEDSWAHMSPSLFWNRNSMSAVIFVDMETPLELCRFPVWRFRLERNLVRLLACQEHHCCVRYPSSQILQWKWRSQRRIWTIICKVQPMHRTTLKTERVCLTTLHQWFSILLQRQLQVYARCTSWRYSEIQSSSVPS